ncbi:hypothetical protein chiPu_0014318 [Chiloscyllium punctatum]|uniref:Uncharacterized protein n=1 Tax=Chiloscyllium punctatum TaxID=137246 RepID=A0A401SZM3_CHIPU|nr:hypothetical protein [Chiloscyllium punctatum]
MCNGALGGSGSGPEARMEEARNPGTAAAPCEPSARSLTQSLAGGQPPFLQPVPSRPVRPQLSRCCCIRARLPVCLSE